jgi:periplasmic divalent cation tolerance protein
MAREREVTADKVIWIYTTLPGLPEAETMAGRLVRERLAACVNIIPGVVSVYEWKGQIERSQECGCFVKTTAARRDAAMAVIKDGHPYDTPALLIFEADMVSPDFAAWIVEQTR